MIPGRPLAGRLIAVLRVIRETRLAAGLIVALAMILSLVVFAPAAQATFPGKNGKLALQSNNYATAGYYDRNNFVYTINPDGTGLTLISDRDSGRALWSPDGGRLAFVSGLLTSCCHTNLGLEVVNADGSGGSFVTNIGDNPSQFTWSPDGSRFFFVRTGKYLVRHLYSIGVDGKGETRLTEGPVYDRVAPTTPWYEDYGFDPSPSGDRIALIRARVDPNAHMYPADAPTDLWLLNADGSAATQVTHDGIAVGPIAWSSGSQIAFTASTKTASDFIHYDDEVEKINLDGSGRTQLTHFGDPGGIGSLSWSPDGTRLLFSRTTLDKSASNWVIDVYEMKADGSQLTKLTNTGHAGQPVWSPDGQKIAFGESEPNYSDSSLYITNADGSGRAEVTSGPYGATDWQPIPGPQRSDYKNANQFCKAEQAFWGDQFSQRYRNFGQCVSGK